MLFSFLIIFVFLMKQFCKGINFLANRTKLAHLGFHCHFKAQTGTKTKSNQYKLQFSWQDPTITTTHNILIIPFNFLSKLAIFGPLCIIILILFFIYGEFLNNECIDVSVFFFPLPWENNTHPPAKMGKPPQFFGVMHPSVL